MGEVRKAVRASAEEKLERASRWIIKLQDGYDSHKKYVAEQAAGLSYRVAIANDYGAACERLKLDPKKPLMPGQYVDQTGPEAELKPHQVVALD